MTTTRAARPTRHPEADCTTTYAFSMHVAAIWMNRLVSGRRAGAGRGGRWWAQASLFLGGWSKGFRNPYCYLEGSMNIHEPTEQGCLFSPSAL